MTIFVEKYASVAGAGSHDGSSAANAWTIAEATASVAAGNRVNCLAGTYIANDSGSSAVMDLDIVGTSGAWIEWRAYTTTIGDFVPGTAQPVVLNAGTNSLTNAVIATTIPSAAYNRFIGFGFTGASSHGFNGGTTVDTASFVGCKFNNNGGRGLAADNEFTFFLCEFTANTTNALDADNNLTIDGCKIHNENIATGVITTATNFTIINCLSYNNSNGVQYRFPGNGIFEGNTLDGDGGGSSIGVQMSGGSNRFVQLANNIFFDLNVGVDFATSGIETVSVGGFNLFSNCNTDYDNNPNDPTDISNSIDPFEDSANRDYTLATGSAAIGAGADAGNIV